MDLIPKVEVKLDLSNTAEHVYADAASPLLKELSKIGLDVVRTFRLATLPFQYGAYYQGRLERHFSEALSRVPSEHRIAPVESVVLQISENLRFQEDGAILTEMYVALLECAFDKRRFGQVHPAFANLVAQLSADEAVLINHLSSEHAKIYIGKTAVPWAQTSNGIKSHFAVQVLEAIELDWKYFINPDILAESSYLQLYVEHLVSLGMVVYDNDRPLGLAQSFGLLGNEQGWAVRLSAFGKLFHQACTEQAVLRATKKDRI